MMGRTRALLDVVLVAAFLVAISVPALAVIVEPERARVDKAGEALATCPAVSDVMSDVEKSITAFKSCFRDRFGFREQLIRWNALFRVRLLHVSTSPRVLIGRNGWLMYADERAVEDYEGAVPFTPDELANWRTTLDRWGQLLASRGIPFVFVVAPNKPTIYPEATPRWLERRGRPTRADQLYAAFGSDPLVTMIDLRPALRGTRERLQTPLYYETDTHWNNLGAYVGFQAVAAELARRFPGVPAARAAETVPTTLTRRTAGDYGRGDLARMLGLERDLDDLDVELPPPTPKLARFVEPDTTVLTQNARAESRPRQVSERTPAPIGRAIVFRDSFSDAMLPHLAELFGRGVYAWTHELDLELIEREKPDVVIMEMVERSLMQPAPFSAPQAGR